jgi:hypothetical protein
MVLGEGHACVRGGGGHNSDEGTDTMVLYSIYVQYYVPYALCLFLKAWLKAGLAVRTEYLRWKFRNNEKVKRRN